MRYQSGVTDQYIYFVAVDSTDLKTRETGLSSFTVYRSRDGGAAVAYTTPTVNETDTTNMPGVYELLLDEDMTIGAGNDSEAVVLHITQAAMAPVTLTYELYRPVVTAGSTLDVTATGAAGIDWGNVENKTTVNALTNTSIITTQQVDVNTIKTNPVVNAGTVTFPTGATLASTTNITAGTITTTTNLTNAPTAGDFTATMKTSIGTAVAASAVASVTGNVGGNVTGSVGSVASGGITATSIAADAIGASELAADAVTEIATGVWDRLTSALTTVGSAGKLLVDNLNATVSSRASQTTLDTLDDFVDTEVAAIKTKTDFLPSATAGSAGGLFIAGTNAATTITTALTTTITGNLTGSVGSVTGLTAANLDVAVSSRASQTTLDTLDDFVDTEVAAIKAKTDQLTFGTANRVDAQVYGIEAGAITATAVATGAIDADALAADAVNEIVDQVWRETLSDHDTVVGSTAEALAGAGGGSAPTAAQVADAVWRELIADHDTVAGSTAEQLSAAGTGGDPWATALPGAYSAGQAGKIIGDNINATISSRATQTSVDTIDDFLDTEITAIKAKTDNLPATPAATGDAMTLTAAYDFAKGTVAMTESYPTQGATMTPAQALYSVHQHLYEKAIAATTVTVKQRDGSTTAKTATLDDATTPTSITEAT